MELSTLDLSSKESMPILGCFLLNITRFPSGLSSDLSNSLNATVNPFDCRVNNVFLFSYRRELQALQAENYALEKQVHSYQLSIARNNAKWSLPEGESDGGGGGGGGARGARGSDA